MNTPDPLPPGPVDDTLLAAEYVLGVMEAGERRGFAARLAREPSLAREVVQWQHRLAPMAADFEDVVPPLSLWPRIRAQAGLLPSAADAARGVPLWERLAFWRGVGLAGAVATAACVLALAVLPRPVPVPPAPAHSPLPHPLQLVATASTPSGEPALVAAVDDDACTLVVMPLRAAQAPRGKVAQLWFVSADGRPHSLGLGQRVPMQAITVPPALRGDMLAQGALAVSLEAPGGSSTGLPSRVIAQGRLTRLSP